MDPSQEGPLTRPEVRWGVGCLVAGAALVGVVILVLLVAIALSPPTWVQVVLGVLLAAGGAALAWLVASALRSGRDDADAFRRRSPR
jgi:threonine/homoserine/homoserine lactone efflux protein